MAVTDYRPDIDGLRALAVVLVLGFHAFPDHVRGGFLGVDVFFVISGFLITRIVTKGDFSFRQFYERRARRLFPALSLVIAVSLAFGWILLTPNQLQSLGMQALSTATFWPNLLFWSETGYFDAAAATKPLLNMWSLGVEEQFYLVWPTLLIAAARFRLRRDWLLIGITMVSLLTCGHLEEWRRRT